MTRGEFDRLVDSLKNGNNEVLKALQSFQEPCISMLIAKSNGTCSGDDAYDIFMDSVMIFRKNAIRGKVTYGNVGAYLKSTCWNTWLAASRKRRRRRQKGEKVRIEMYELRFDQSDPFEEKAAAEARAEKIGRVKEAMAKLTSACQSILKYAIIEERPMKEIAEIMGFANANVAKTTKSRCYKRLLKLIEKT